MGGGVVSGPLACPGPVEKWFPQTVPPGDSVWQATQCYEHTTSIVVAGIIAVFVLLGILIVYLMGRDFDRRMGL